MSKNKVIVRLKGGLGNQLFCYSVARRLALVNHAELVIDHVTGFRRDRIYNRDYALSSFAIPARFATSSERMEPLERYRRALCKLIERRKPFCDRGYLESEYLDFDERVLHLRFKGTVYLDGLWFSEKYFSDIQDTIRSDLRPNTDLASQSPYYSEIVSTNSIAVHVRWFDSPSSSDGYNLSTKYYSEAVARICDMIPDARFFVFSDQPASARKNLSFRPTSSVFIDHEDSEDKTALEFHLLRSCKHFIIANSTYSWWASWLPENTEKIVIAPRVQLRGKTAWGFKGLFPETWITV